MRGQNRVVTEGIDTTEGTNAAGIYQDFFAHEEVSVSASAPTSMSTPGSAVVSSIKSGGNEFKSLNNVTYEGSRFVDNNIDDDTRARVHGAAEPEVLGSALRSRRADQARQGVVLCGLQRVHDRQGDLRRLAPVHRPGRVRELHGEGHVSRVAGDAGRLLPVGREEQAAARPVVGGRSGQHSRAERAVRNVERAASARVEQPPVHRHESRLVGLRVADGAGGRLASAPPRIDTATSVETGAGWLAGNQGGPFTFQRDKPQFTMTATYYLPERWAITTSKPGSSTPTISRGMATTATPARSSIAIATGLIGEIRVTDFNTFEAFGTDWTGPDDRNERWSAFFQDRWRPASRMTITAGIRYDRQRPHYEASIRKPILTEIFPEQTVPAASFFTRSTIVPRLGFAYDVSSKGKSVAKVFFGRYYYNFADRLAGANPAAPTGATTGSTT